MGKHEPIGLALQLGEPLALLGTMATDLLDTAPHLVPPLEQAYSSVQDAILRDERGPPLPPEYTEEAMSWQPPPMPAYTAAAIEGELLTLQNAPPESAKGTLANTSYQLARWAGAGYLPARDGKRAIWKVASASGAIAALGRDNAKKLISQNWARGEKNPRKAPTKGAQNG